MRAPIGLLAVLVWVVAGGCDDERGNVVGGMGGEGGEALVPPDLTDEGGDSRPGDAGQGGAGGGGAGGSGGFGGEGGVDDGVTIRLDMGGEVDGGGGAGGADAGGGGCVEGATRWCEGRCPESVETCQGGGWSDCSAPPELCGGGDEDCDGVVDEGYFIGRACSVGVGGCVGHGTWICAGREAVCDAGAGRPEVEACNAVDDDCDGIVDERLVEGGGGPCVLGRGVCAADGIVVCREGGAYCAGEAGVPGVEGCNGFDDDCDGRVDEGFGELGAGCVRGVGACAVAGVWGCEEGIGACLGEEGAAGVEVCDGVDDDCDGRVDEGVGGGEACEAGAGACREGGRTVCDGNGEAVCQVAGVAAGEEVCNGVDDDCDGSSDEGFGVGDVCSDGVGACRREGRVVCDGDGMEPVARCTARAGGPVEEVCNGVDDDCNGTVDEGFGAVCDGDGCRAGGPVDEVCNGIDDDCDGVSDEGFGLGEVCEVGLGVCRRGGRLVCGAGAVVCSAVVGVGGEEQCNGRDDDCDGMSDEGFGVGDGCEVGVGRCLSVGEVVCGGDGVAVCGAVEGPRRPESCNGLDDDCDGRVDEGIGLGEACRVGVGACVAVGVRVCGGDGAVVCPAVPGVAQVEKCNGEDDDCDGMNDEGTGLGERCTVGLGECLERGRNVCDGEGGVRCGAIPGVGGAEACNGVDDDCDGRSDEGFGLGEACLVGEGPCRQAGQRMCRAGGVACSAAPLPGRVERCDGVDDDCDGAVDEDYQLGAECVSGLGVCAREGLRVCGPGGAGACDAVAGPAGEEVCDDVDNDCDGIVDEGTGPAAGLAFGGCGPRYRSCLDALRQGQGVSGVYRISPVDGAGAEVWCDQRTDGGGWTLVVSTAAPPVDGVGAWHAGLLRTDPRAAAAGVWAGLSHLPDAMFDLRFVCRAAVGDVGAGHDVDLAFYGTPWYRQLIAGDEAGSCFATPEAVDAPAARRDLLGLEARAAGQPYPNGALVGEAECGAPSDFVIDFDDGGLGGEGIDGTDWGMVGGAGVCGGVAGRGQWLVFAREAVEAPLGLIGVMGVDSLVDPLRRAGFMPVVLGFDPARLRAGLDVARVPAVFIGRYSFAWAQMSAEVRALLEAYSRAGGSIVTEFDGMAIFGFAIDGSFVNGIGAPRDGLLGWLDARAGWGQVRAVDTEIEVLKPADPVMRGLSPSFVAGEGGERFTGFAPLAAGIELKMVALARYAGNGGRWPAAWYDAVLRGARCRGHLLFVQFDYADAPAHPAVVRLVGNLAAAAVSRAPAGVIDVCPSVVVEPGGRP